MSDSRQQASGDKTAGPVVGGTLAAVAVGLLGIGLYGTDLRPVTRAAGYATGTGNKYALEAG
jgi:hypothetical protein